MLIVGLFLQSLLPILFSSLLIQEKSLQDRILTSFLRNFQQCPERAFTSQLFTCCWNLFLSGWLAPSHPLPKLLNMIFISLPFFLTQYGRHLGVSFSPCLSLLWEFHTHHTSGWALGSHVWVWAHDLASMVLTGPGKYETHTWVKPSLSSRFRNWAGDSNGNLSWSLRCRKCRQGRLCHVNVESVKTGL